MSIRIRIKKVPEAKTGDQVGFGLFTGPHSYIDDSSNESSLNKFKETLSPVSRDEANIEAERGETAVGDFDQDGMLEHFKIGGDRHSNGGTPLNVPGGTFIFSDTKKLSLKGSVLANFGKSENTKAVFTPAKLAKQYDLNKYKQLLNDPNSDKYDRDTAELMLENNNRKLAELAIVQEGMKGFPNGIPEIAASLMNQGQPEQVDEDRTEQEFQFGGPVDEAIDRQIRLTAQRNRAAASKRKSNNKVTLPWDSYLNPTPPPAALIANSPWAFPKNPGTAVQQPVSNTLTADEYAKRMEETLKKHEEQTTNYIPSDPVEKAKFMQSVGVSNPNTLRKNFDFNIPIPNVGNPFAEKPAGFDLGENAPVDQSMPWTNEDKINLGNAFMNRFNTKKYMPTFVGANTVLPEATFFDNTRQIAANQEQAAQQNQMNSMFAGPQRFRSAGSQIQGQAMNFAANAIGQTENQNVDVANNFSNVRAGIVNDTAMKNAMSKKQYLDELTVVNQQYDNSVTQGNEGVRMHLVNGMDNAKKFYMMNKFTPQYKIDAATGQINFTKGKSLGNAGPGTGAAPGISEYKSLYDQHYTQFGDAKLAHDFAMKNATATKSRVSTDPDGNTSYGFSGAGLNPLLMQSIMGRQPLPVRFPGKP